MKEQMSQQLQATLVDMMTTLKDAAAWSAAMAKQELPLLVQEYLRWGVVESFLWTLLWAVVVFALLRLGKICREYPYKDPSRYGYDNDGRSFGLAMGHVGFRLIAAFASIGVVVNLMTAAKILTAPRVYLLEQVSTLIRSLS